MSILCILFLATAFKSYELHLEYWYFFQIFPTLEIILIRGWTKDKDEIKPPKQCDFMDFSFVNRSDISIRTKHLHGKYTWLFFHVICMIPIRVPRTHPLKTKTRNKSGHGSTQFKVGNPRSNYFESWNKVYIAHNESRKNVEEM